jgi:hypothetical protein
MVEFYPQSGIPPIEIFDISEGPVKLLARTGQPNERVLYYIHELRQYEIRHRDDGRVLKRISFISPIVTRQLVID